MILWFIVLAAYGEYKAWSTDLSIWENHENFREMLRGTFNWRPKYSILVAVEKVTDFIQGRGVAWGCYLS